MSSRDPHFKMATHSETWSRNEVRIVIRFLWARSAAEIHDSLLKCTVNAQRNLIECRHEHPSYNPDLAPSNYNLFGPLKKQHGGRKFGIDGEVQRAL